MFCCLVLSCELVFDEQYALFSGSDNKWINTRLNLCPAGTKTPVSETDIETTDINTPL